MHFSGSSDENQIIKDKAKRGLMYYVNDETMINPTMISNYLRTHEYLRQSEQLEFHNEDVARIINDILQGWDLLLDDGYQYQSHLFLMRFVKMNELTFSPG
eukprot:UN15926